MSNRAGRRPRTKTSAASKPRFVIVASRFNPAYVQGLIDHASTELGRLSPRAFFTVMRVPGAFEIPVVVRELAAKKKGDAIIAIGVILKGKTNHAENLSRSVTNALQQIAIDHSVPVINAVLSFDDETQARERCLEDRINRGAEAARAAVEIVDVMAKLRRK
jgi:6,7-dimethyl-8-ribityllumazine synthase